MEIPVQINLDQIQLIHETVAEGEWVEAANLALYAGGMEDVEIKTREEAHTVLRTLENNLAEDNRYIELATLLWGNHMFDARPSVVQKVFKGILSNSRLLICGGSSLSKTFSAGALFYMFWRQDPYWTAVKLAAPSETHLYTNLFSHLIAMHRGAAIPMTLDDNKNLSVNETEMFIAMKDSLPEMRIQGILCKQNAVSAGAMRGHKPKPYRKPIHPIWGNSTRLFILIDEGSQVSPGAFEDIKTTEASIDESIRNVQITIAFNPEEISDRVVKMAEPEHGWQVEQVDTLYEWVSKEGYPVIRLDGKNFENVVQQKIIYPRMLTHEAYMSFLRAGEHSAQYWAKGRGFPPLKDNAWTFIPAAWVQSQRGEPIFTGTVTNIAGLDPAFSGGDKAILGIGRWGVASGWRKASGETEWFVSRLNPAQKIKKHVLVVDQLFELPKTNNSVELVQEVMGRCKILQIEPQNMVMDAMGNAHGVWSHAKKYWGDVLAVNGGEASTESKILSDHLMTANDVYERKSSELWFSVKYWMDPIVCAFLINPIVPTHPLFSQLTSRRYRTIRGGKIQVEPKHEYRARNANTSPDEADVVTYLVEWCRRRGHYIPGVEESQNTEVSAEMGRVSLENADVPDTLGGVEWQPGNMNDLIDVESGE